MSECIYYNRIPINLVVPAFIQGIALIIYICSNMTMSGELQKTPEWKIYGIKY